jgi:hypothetical protein
LIWFLAQNSRFRSLRSIRLKVFLGIFVLFGFKFDFTPSQTTMGLRPLIRRGRAVFRRVKLDQEETATTSSIDADVSRTTVEPTEKSRDGEAQIPPTDPEEGIATNGKGVAPVPFEKLQTGVKDVEALAETWSKTSLIAVFIKYVNLCTPTCFIQSPNTS